MIAVRRPALVNARVLRRGWLTVERVHRARIAGSVPLSVGVAAAEARELKQNTATTLREIANPCSARAFSLKSARRNAI